MPDSDRDFVGSIPKLYDEYLVPLLFQTYAVDLVERLRSRSPSRVLEIAAGTGVVTRALASGLESTVSIVATDLNPAMLDYAASRGASRPVTWRPADAMELPFRDAEFDAVVCQFGAMFFPDKAKAFSETRRVLRPGGVFLFNVWDRIEENEFADVVTAELARMFPDDPPRFLARTPHGYHDPAAVRRDLASGGFAKAPHIATVAARSRATSARVPAVAYCEGTPLRNDIEARALGARDIEARGPSRINEATDAAERAIAERFGSGAVDGKIQAHVVAVKR